MLGVTKESTDSDIKKAYKKLALKLHPDKNKAPGANEAFKGKFLSCLDGRGKRKRKKKKRDGFDGTKREA